jgi:hypothetical protein
MISLSTDLEVIRNGRKIIFTAMNRGNWVLVHYSKPTYAAAAMLVDVASQMTTTSVNTNFRLIVICRSVDFLSPWMLARSKRIKVDSFPALRFTVTELYHHHTPAIRAQTNPRAMRRLSFVSVMLMAMLNYRSFIQPGGLNMFEPCGDIAFRELLEKLRTIVDAYPNDIPFKNILSYLDSVTLSCFGDPFDRRVCHSYLQTLFARELLDDGFSLCKGTGEAEKWIVPVEGPTGSYTQMIQQMPMFGGVEILQMHGRSSTPLRNWCLSRWVLGPFCTNKRDSALPESDAISVKIDNTLILLPERIAISEEVKFKGLCLQCLLQEIEKINEVLSLMRGRLSEGSEETKKGVIREDIMNVLREIAPIEWRKSARYYCSTSMTKFTSHIIQRHAFLMGWLQRQDVTVIDVRLIDNLRGFMLAFLNECASQMSTTVDSLAYEFQLNGTGESGETVFVLTNLYLMSGGVKEDSTLTVPDDEKVTVFNSIATMSCKVVRKVQMRGKTLYNCPLYRTAFCSGLGQDLSDLQLWEGKGENLVWECGLVADKLDSEFAGYGTALYCRVPDQFGS